MKLTNDRPYCYYNCVQYAGNAAVAADSTEAFDDCSRRSQITGEILGIFIGGLTAAIIPSKW